MSGDVTPEREALIEALHAASWPDGDTQGFPANAICKMLADAVLTSDFLAAHDARVKREAAAEAEVRALRETADRLSDFVFPAGSDALELVYRLVTELRHKADRIEEARGGTH